MRYLILCTGSEGRPRARRSDIEAPLLTRSSRDLVLVFETLLFPHPEGKDAWRWPSVLESQDRDLRAAGVYAVETGLQTKRRVEAPSEFHAFLEVVTGSRRHGAGCNCLATTSCYGS